MELKEKTRERSNARFFAMDTLRMVIDWISQSNPQNYLGKTSKDTLSEAEQEKMRNWVEKAGDLIDKTWHLPDMLVDDAIKVLSEATSAKPPTTPEVK